MNDMILVYVLHYMISPKVRYTCTPIIKQQSFAVKGRRKQELKKVGSACGVT
jgi:hypothetical protein